MLLKYITLFMLGLSLISSSQEKETEKPKSAKDDAAELEQTLQTIYSSREEAEFNKAVNKAKELKVSEQIILESTFLFHVDNENYESIAKLAETFEQQLKKFDSDQSKIFTSKEDWMSVIEYAKALKALQKNDMVGFEKHIKEAFWYSPDKSSAFAHHIIDWRNVEAMKKVKIDLNRKIVKITGGDENIKHVTLAKMLQGKEALVLRYWSPWNQQVDNSFPAVQKIAKACNENRIAFASILLNQEGQAVADAKEVIGEVNGSFKSWWLADTEKNSLAKILRISDLPTLVVIRKDGTVAYHGSALNKKMWNVLEKLDPKWKAPK